LQDEYVCDSTGGQNSNAAARVRMDLENITLEMKLE